MQNTNTIISGLPNALVSNFDKMFSRLGEPSFLDITEPVEVEDIPHELIGTKIYSNQRNLEN